MPQAVALQRGDDVVGVADDQLARVARARLLEDQLVVELGPDRHHRVAQPDQGRARRVELVEHPGGNARGQLLGFGLGFDQDAPGGSGDLVVARSGFEVLLVHMRPWREPVPEQVGERGASAAAVGGRVGVGAQVVVDADLRAGHADALVAVDRGEHPPAQRDHPPRQPVRQAGQNQRQRQRHDPERDQQ